MFTSVVLNPNFNEPIFVIVTFKEITLCIQNLRNILKVFAVLNCFHFTFDDHVSFSAVEKSDSLVNMTTHSIEISRTFMYT